MAVPDRRAILKHVLYMAPARHTAAFLRALHLSFILCLLLLQGCGLIIDAITMVYPLTKNELDRICRLQQVQVGMAVEPLRPFVFPAVWTDEGARVTGLDAELIRTIGEAFTAHCRTPVVPVLHLVHFRDLFLLLNEGQLDFFVSAVAVGVPSPTRAGFAYSNPYFSQGGVGVIAKRPEIVQQIQDRVQKAGDVTARDRILDGLTIAAQDSTAAHLYADANLKSNRLIVCDSLPAAFEEAEAGGTQPIDAIIGAHPVLEFMVKTTRKDWRLLKGPEDKPLRLTQADYAVVMAEESYQLRWFVNQVIFQLAESGRLQTMRQRWIEDSYAYPRRASTEGLPFDASKMVMHYDQGTCRPRTGR